MSKAEKFIQDCTRSGSNELISVESRVGKEVISYNKWLTPEQALKAIEIAKEEILENEHEKSWRLDEKLWKGIKDVEEASYQYIYDASNDWAYDIPTWEDVQDAFKAGNEWKEGLELTWEDIRDIARIYLEEGVVDAVFDVEKHCKEVLKRFLDFKEKKDK